MAAGALRCPLCAELRAAFFTRSYSGVLFSGSRSLPLLTTPQPLTNNAPFSSARAPCRAATPEARHSPRCSRLSTSDASGFLQSPAAPTAGVVGSERQLAVGAGGLQCLQSSRRHKVDSVFKGKRSMFPSSGPMQDFGVSLFDKQKRRTALWLETERQRIAKLPAPLRPLEIQRALVLYKEKLKELYGEDYVRREWSTLSKLTRAKLLEAE